LVIDDETVTKAKLRPGDTWVGNKYSPHSNPNEMVNINLESEFLFRFRLFKLSDVSIYQNTILDEIESAVTRHRAPFGLQPARVSGASAAVYVANAQPKVKKNLPS
jgi:hypothetical protein